MSYPTQTCTETASVISYATEEKVPPQFPPTICAVQDSHAGHARGRTLVICLDGTGDKFDSDNSNVVNFVACLKKDDPSQITYYQSGIGTYDGHGMSKGIDAAVDMAVGSGLGVHIRDAYEFLMDNYNEGDKICLLGFSRGAYTVRCLAGMLRKVGLLPAQNREQVHFAYNFYKNDTPEGYKMSLEFKRTFCTDVNVYFVGVWDCVASVGVIPRELPFSKSPTNSIGYFRHAMALDEHRAKFKVLQWQHEGLLKDTKGFHGHHHKRRTDVLEVWFAGAHADVGGGAVANESRHMLSRIPLRWMIRQCFLCNTDILFKSAALAETGLDLHTVYPICLPQKRPVVGPSPRALEQYRSGTLPPLQRRSTVLGLSSKIEERFSHDPPTLDFEINGRKYTYNEAELLPEQVEDHFDALSAINDQLVIAKGWWVLEFWPIKVRRVQDGKKVTVLNRGRFRGISDREPKMHWTVELRMEDKKYKLRNAVAEEAIWGVEG